MYLDGRFNFGIPIITNSTATVASTNIYDAGADRTEFGPMCPQLWLWFRVVVTADASDATVRVNFIASGESDLDPDNSAESNDILASTGIIDMQDDGTGVLESGDTVERAVPIQVQRIARRYYGLLITLGGTNPDLAALSDAEVVTNPQTNMPGARAAVPA
jgi:hypothetical protein